MKKYLSLILILFIFIFKEKKRPRSTITKKRNHKEISHEKQRVSLNLTESNDECSDITPLLFQLKNESNHLQKLVLKAKSTNPLEQLKAVQFVRELLSTETNPPIDSVIESGILPILVKFLERNEQ